MRICLSSSSTLGATETPQPDTGSRSTRLTCPDPASELPFRADGPKGRWAPAAFSRAGGPTQGPLAHPADPKHLRAAALRYGGREEQSRFLEEAVRWMRLAPLKHVGPERVQSFTRAATKVALHRHLEGAITPEILLAVAMRHGIPLPTYDIEELRHHVQIGDGGTSLLDFLAKFDLLGEAFRDRSVIEEITHEVVCDAARDKIGYLELRFSPSYMAEAHGLNLEEVIGGVLDGVRSGQKVAPVDVRLILVVERQLGVELAAAIERLAEKYRKDGVVGLDLANDEHNFPPDPYAAVFQRAKRHGLKVTVHAGEAAGAQNVRTAIEQLHADRIGHGVRAQEDPAVVDLIHNRGVAVEMYPTSNLQTGTIASLNEHPLRAFLRRGIKVCVSTDDPGISNVTLSGELATITLAQDLSLEDLERLMCDHAVQAAFLTPREAAKLAQRVGDSFRSAADKLVNSLTVSELVTLAFHGLEAADNLTEAERIAAGNRLVRGLVQLQRSQ